ncbi:hypothetical protein [Streptomyces sp. NBC_01373]|uniref:hypothetical protein n=1 Tax=Streptomyces sp. NBC_01373 TaxID=2903843 RepID=UPI002250678A|nr:hypothetical protein [Streptomyces sp. NBC_01373]MCX4703877.1 hypothetical protein [Streptomyces sp. NBC_01373]
MTTGNEPTVPDDPPSPGPQGDPQRRDRNSMGRFTRTLASVRRDTAAVEYLADHPGTTYEELKERFGYAHRSDAKKGIERAKADVARPAVTRLIATESEELDALYTEAVAILQRNHVTVSHGKVITWRNPDTGEEEPLQDDGPKLQAIQVALRVRESYRKLHGLDQPSQVAVSGGVKYEVVGVDTSDLT